MIFTKNKRLDKSNNSSPLAFNFFNQLERSMIRTAILALATGIGMQAWGQTAPKYSNEFLSLGVGGRALGMGSAQVSQVNDVTAGYWNPAGLVMAKGDIQIAFMHNEYFAGIAKYDYLGLTAPIDSMRHIGVSMLRFGIDDIANTIDLKDQDGNINYDRITGFSAADYAFLISFASKTRITGLHYGANVKIIHRKVGDFAKAWGFGLDAGLQYTSGEWRIGAMLRDVTSTFNAWSYTLDDRTKDVFTETGNDIPENGLELTLPRLIPGVSREFVLKKFSIAPAIDLEMTFDGKRNTLVKTNFASIDPRVGIETGYNHLVFLRVGVSNFQEVTDTDGKKKTTVQPNLGVGIRLKSLSLDYALTNIGNSNNLYSNVFSIRLNIYKQKKT